MSRFRRLLVVTGVVAAVVAVSAVGAVAASAGDGPATAPAASPGCYPKGSTTIAKDKAGRYYSVTTRPSTYPGGPTLVVSWYLCSFKQGTPRSAGAGVDRSAKVSGRYVAFFLICRCVEAGKGPLTVIDMVTGLRTFFSWRSRSGEGNEDLVLKPDGSVAWTTATRFNPTTWEVRRHDSTGTATVDSGPGINPHSLAAGGSWLYWTDDGSPRSAPFH